MKTSDEQVSERIAEATRPYWVWAGTAIIAIAVLACAGFLTRRGRLQPEQPVVLLRDGGSTLSISPTGHLSGAPPLPLSDTATLRDVLSSGRVPKAPGLPTLPATGAQAPSAGNAEMRVVSPVESRVFLARPEFRWTPVANASTYQVTVFTDDSKEVAQSPNLTTTSWQPGSALPRDRILIWQVTAYRTPVPLTAPTPPAPPARFEIISEAAATHIAELSQASSPVHTLLCALYAREGLTWEAEQELNQLDVANPGSPLVQSLRQSLTGK